MTAARTIPFGRPMLGTAEKRLAAEVLDGTTLTHGPRCAEFEAKFAARIGAKHAITVSSCTTGLQLALMAIGLEPGDEVIVPAETHVATAHAVEHSGGRPVFVDVDRATGNIDPGKVAAALTPRTRAIMPVHYLGLPCAMDELQSLARPRGIAIVEDCALALGAEYGGRHPGVLGTAGAFSFYPAKHITTLEGGMVTTDDAAMAARLRNLRAFGYDKAFDERKIPGIYDVVALGHNFRMSEVQAAVGLGQLDQLDAFLAARRRNTAILLQGLAKVGGIATFPVEYGKARSAHYCVNIVLSEGDGIDRDGTILRLNAAGVGTSVHYPVPVPLMRYYRQKYGYRDGQFPVAEWISARAISLPVGPHVSADDAHFIVEAVAGVLGGTL
ncbi:MAG: DegT/DnrJ/EryC1/StrS family aminotransferase [Alphaproteobacteria bacterium]